MFNIVDVNRWVSDVNLPEFTHQAIKLPEELIIGDIPVYKVFSPVGCTIKPNGSFAVPTGLTTKLQGLEFITTKEFENSGVIITEITCGSEEDQLWIHYTNNSDTPLDINLHTVLAYIKVIPVEDKLLNNKEK